MPVFPGRPDVPPSTANAGSAQQSTHLIAGLIATDALDVGIGCGVEAMSRVPPRCQCRCARRTSSTCLLETSTCPINSRPLERIARRRNLTRTDIEAFGVHSQVKAPPRVGGATVSTPKCLPVTAPVSLIRARNLPTRWSRKIRVCERPLRRHLLRSPRSLPAEYTPPEPRRRFPTAQLQVLLMDHTRAEQLGLTPRARIVRAMPRRRRTRIPTSTDRYRQPVGCSTRPE